MHAYTGRVEAGEPDSGSEIDSGSGRKHLDHPEQRLMQQNILFVDSVRSHENDSSALDGVPMGQTVQPSAATKVDSDFAQKLVNSTASTAAASTPEAEDSAAIAACWKHDPSANAAHHVGAQRSTAQPATASLENQMDVQDTAVHAKDCDSGDPTRVIASMDSTVAALHELLSDSSISQDIQSSAHSTAGSEASLQDVLCSTLSLAESVEQSAACAVCAQLAEPEQATYASMLMCTMLELDKLTQELKRRLLTASGESVEDQASVTTDKSVQDVPSITTDSFRHALVNQFSAANWKDGKGSVADLDRFRHELVNKLCTVVPALQSTGRDRQKNAQV